MGGSKKKQPQRTKGNARPSSSSRSAVRLMQADGSPRLVAFAGSHHHHQQQQPLGTLEPFASIGLAAVGQIGFGLKDTDAAGVPVAESDDGDCRLLMKKMSKKDSITRLKALQEFQAFCASCSEGALIGALPAWPRLYNRLSSDYDRRVREAAHKAHGQLVSRAGRNLAPHLKALMGPWLMGRCDPYGSSASAAILAFSETFKGSLKQSDAIVFCKEEVLNHIFDVIYNQSPQSLCDAEICPPEESEITFNRLVAVALQALTLYLDFVPTEEHDKSVDAYSNFLNNPKFWKLAKSKEPSIRAAWFNTISAFCRRHPPVLDAHLARCSPLVLGALDEEDPVVGPATWEAALHLIVTHKASWNHVNVQKAVVPKLMSITRKGYEGNAVLVCPNLLPLLSNIPDDALKDGQRFFNDLIENLIFGLDLPKIQASPADSSAIVSALVECLRYVANKSSDFGDDFLLAHLLPIIKSSLTKRDSVLSATPLYDLTGHYLMRRCGQQFDAAFWSTIGPMCVAAVEQLDDGESSFVMQRVASMFSAFASAHPSTTGTLVAACGKSTKKKAVVKFAEDEEEDKIDEPNADAGTVLITMSPLPDGPFLRVVSSVCVVLQDRYIMKKSAEHLEFLTKLVPAYACRLLFKELLANGEIDVENCRRTSTEEVSSLAKRYFDGVVKRWLHEAKSRKDSAAAHDFDRSASALVSLIVGAILPLVEQKAKVLDEVCALRDAALLDRLLRTVLISEIAWLQDPVVKDWLAGPTLADAILTFTKASVGCSSGNDDDDRGAWRLLTLFSESSFDAFGPNLPIAVLKVIFETLGTAIHDPNRAGTDGNGVDAVLILVAKLAKSLFRGSTDCWKISSVCEDVLFAFFLLLCKPVPVIQPDTSKVLEDLLIDGTTLLVSNKGARLEREGFLRKVCLHFHDTIRIKNVANHLEMMAYLIRALLSAIRCSSSDGASDLAMQVLDLSVLDAHEHRLVESNLVRHSLLDHLAHGEICIVSPPVSDPDPDATIDDDPSTSLMLASSVLASEGLLIVTSSADDLHDRLIPHLTRILFARTYCKMCLRPGQKLVVSAEEAANIRRWSASLDTNLRYLIERISASKSSCLSKIVDECRQLAEEHGLVWSYALIELESLIGELAPDYALDIAKIVDFEKSLTCQGALHNVQLHLKYEKVSKDVGRRFVQNVFECTDDETRDASHLAILTSTLAGLDVSDKTTRDYIHAAMDIVLRCNDLSDIPAEDEIVSMKWDELCFHVQVLRLLTEIVSLEGRGNAFLTRDHWDHVLCCLGTWLDRMTVHKLDGRKIEMNLLATALFRFSTSVTSTIIQFKSDGLLNEDLAAEWGDFFSKRIYGRLLFLFVASAKLWICAVGVSNGKKYVMESLAKSLIGMPASVAGLPAEPGASMSCQLPTPPVADRDYDEGAYSFDFSIDRVEATFNHLCPLLNSRFRAVRYGAYNALKDFVFNYPKSDLFAMKVKEVAEIDDDDDEDDDIEAVIPGALRDTLTRAKLSLDEDPSFSKCKIGDDNNEIFVDDRLDEQESPNWKIVAFLLAWDLVLSMFSESSSEARYRNAAYLRQNGFARHLLDCLFCLMPTNVNLPDVVVVVATSDASRRAPGKKSAATKRTMFSEEPSIDPQSTFTVGEIQHLACGVYMAAVRHIPALVRDWFNSLDRRTSSLVERFTLSHVSPVLCSKDLAAVRRADGAHLLSGLKVRVRPATREVLATCTVEEISFEIVVKLADNHPLGPITIEAGRPIGVSSSQWSYWTLQLTTFLMHQNGSILDGLILWKRNIDKKFEGVQECYVCFYVLHSTTYQLPKHLCRTCKKKFHSSCLYKWFSTSGHSKCPLCRSIF